jgi:hypothetical protein
VSDIRKIVNQRNNRHLHPQRSGIRRRKKYIEIVGGHRRRQLDLFPPRPGRPADLADSKPSRVERDPERCRCIQDELVRHHGGAARPLAQQGGEMAPDAGHPACELARVDADPHQRACG